MVPQPSRFPGWTLSPQRDSIANEEGGLGLETERGVSEAIGSPPSLADPDWL